MRQADGPSNLDRVTTTPTHAGQAATDSAAGDIDRLVDNVGRVIQGKRDVVEFVVVGLLAEGHLLVEDVPGVGKTSMAKAVARSLDVAFGRIQFTPDLLPADVVGVNVWNRAEHSFDFRPGPVFSAVLLADEINRASPKTQSALLEAMAERQVTIDGTTHRLRRPFVVLATQNPLDHEGTYPLPESQLDRFLLRITVGYPDRQAEREMLDHHDGDDPLDDLGPVIGPERLDQLIASVRAVHVAPALRDYLVALADASRRHVDLELGVSPRATLNLLQVIRARALMAGRPFATPDDVQALAAAALAHRLVPTADALLRGVDAAAVVADLLETVAVPTPERPR
jgi:MoxR-like ATPase